MSEVIKHIVALASQWGKDVVALIGDQPFRPISSERLSTRYGFVAGLLWALANKQTAKAGHGKGAEFWADAMLKHLPSCSGKCVSGPAFVKAGIEVKDGKVTGATRESLIKAFFILIPGALSNIQGMLGQMTLAQEQRGQKPTFYAALSTEQPLVLVFSKAAGHKPIETGFAGVAVPQPK